MNKKDSLEYIKTVIFTMVAAFISVLILLEVIQFNVYNELALEKQQNEVIDYYLIGVLIEKNKYQEEKFPHSYKINLKLGILYELEKDYKNSEIEFKKSIEKAPYGEYQPTYRLALLYVIQDRLNEAQALMDNISEKPQKKLIHYKGNVYNRIGNKLYDKGNYEEAAQKYEKALSYYKIIKAKETEAAENSLASSYVYLAEEKVKKIQIEDAISYLQDALKIVNAPIIKYKLALLLMNDNPDLACKYFDEVFQSEPNLINYDQYYIFLTKLAMEAISNGNLAQAELYQFRIKKMKDYYKSNILSVEDLQFEYSKGTITLNKWKRQYNINLQLKFKNVSKYNINNLYLNVIFKDKDKIIDEYYQNIADSKSLIKSYASTPTISIKSKLQQTKEDKFPKSIVAEIYATKTEKMPKILLGKIKITEETKKQKDYTISP